MGFFFGGGHDLFLLGFRGLSEISSNVEKGFRGGHYQAD